MMSIVLDTQSQPGYSPPTNERTQGKEIGNDEYCSGHPITTMLLTLYMCQKQRRRLEMFSIILDT